MIVYIKFTMKTYKKYECCSDNLLEKHPKNLSFAELRKFGFFVPGL